MKTTEKTPKILSTQIKAERLLTGGLLLVALGTLLNHSAYAAGAPLTWEDNNGGDIGTWMFKAMNAVMYIFMMSGTVLGAMAFKQLSADGNWKDFWSKLAGAAGMFSTPIMVQWALGL
jgi:hypothetical protein